MLEILNTEPNKTREDIGREECEAQFEGRKKR
jgi:hypothetical protein